MSFDTRVLRAMLRLARRRQAAQDDEVALRVGATPSEVRASLRRLRANGLVEIRFGEAARLSLAGLAVAVALLPATARRGALSVSRTSRAA